MFGCQTMFSQMLELQNFFDNGSHNAFGSKEVFMKVFKSNYSGFLLIPFLYNNTSHNIQLNNIRDIRNEIYKKY